MNGVDLLLLDLDGTLYPADSALRRWIDSRTAAFLLEHSGLTAVELDALETEYPSVLEALDHLHIRREHWAGAVHALLPYARCLRPDPGLRIALADVPARRVIVTLAPPEHARRVIRALGLVDVIDDVHSVFDTTDSSKDRIYAEQLVDPAVAAGAVVIGDDPMLDLEPAATYGCRCLLVGHPRAPQPYPTYETLRDALAAITA